MANKLLRMDKVEKIQELHSMGVPKKRIARMLGLSKNTVKKYLSKTDSLAVPTEWSGHQKLSIKAEGGSSQRREDVLKELLPQINRELARPGVTRQLLGEEYKVRHPNGFSYGRFCDRIRAYRMVQSATLKLDHTPARDMMVDFAGKQVHWVDRRAGELVPSEVLVCTLPYSGYTFACAVASQGQDDLVYGINQALLYIGGLPQVILSDNLKSYVKKSDRYEPAFTEFCTQFVGHYGVELQATRVAKPKDKASVERHVQLAYQRVYAPLRDHVFHSMEQINAAFAVQLDALNARTMQGKSSSRAERFAAEERLLLASLPPTLFERKKQTPAKVQRNYHVILGEDKHQYSVPYQYIGQRTHLSYTSTTVEIYRGIERIAVHKRNRRKHAYTTLPGHLPEKHRTYIKQRGWDGDDFRKQAERVGPDTRWAIEQILTSKQMMEQTYNSCLSVLRLQDKFGAYRLEAACTRARSTHRVTYSILRNILNRGTDQLPLQHQQPLFKIPLHDNIRGPSQYEESLFRIQQIQYDEWTSNLTIDAETQARWNGKFLRGHPATPLRPAPGHPRLCCHAH